MRVVCVRKHEVAVRGFSGGRGRGRARWGCSVTPACLSTVAAVPAASPHLGRPAELSQTLGWVSARPPACEDSRMDKPERSSRSLVGWWALPLADGLCQGRQGGCDWSSVGAVINVLYLQMYRKPFLVAPLPTPRPPLSAGAGQHRPSSGSSSKPHPLTKAEGGV